MPGLDVSEALTDPMLADRFDVSRRQQIVGNNGRATVAAQAFRNQIGVITSAGANDLARLDDNQRMGRNLVVVTKFRLRGPADVVGTQFQPDYITWKGDNYIVKDLDPYPQYGVGFVQAIVGSVDSIDQAVPE